MCDCLVALAPATAAGTTLFAKASDRPPAEAQRLEWMPPGPQPGPLRTTYIEVEGAGRTLGVLGSRPWWCWGFEHGVNEAGVAAGNATIYTTLDPRQAPAALIGMDLVRLALERATTAADAVAVMVELVERYGQGGSGHHGAERPYWSSFLVGDPADAWVVETSGRTWASERVERTRAISNRTTIPWFDAAHRHPRQPVDRLVDPRLAVSRAVLADEPVTVDGLRRHLRSHEGREGFSVCMHVPGVEATTAAVVAELPAAGPPLVHVAAGSPCRSLFVPMVVGQPLGPVVAWERLAALVGESELAGLEAALAAQATDEPGWNAGAWQAVDAALARLAEATPPVRQ